MIGADDPDGAVGLQDAPALAEPGTRERVVLGEAREFVPIVVDAVDARIVGAHQIGSELQIVGRVGEDEIDRMVGQLLQRCDAITDDDAIGREGPGRTTQNHLNATFKSWGNTRFAKR